MSSTICFILFFCFILTKSRGSDFATCFKSLLKKTQDCANQKITYASVYANAGLGSEFNTRLVQAFTVAVLEKRRLVFLIDNDPVHQKWEYQCEKKQMWGCYLELPCSDSLVKEADMKQDQKRDFYGEYQRVTEYWPLLEDYIRHSIDMYSDRSNSFKDILHEIFYNPESCAMDDILEDEPDPTFTMITLSTTFLYKLNNSTREKVMKMNAPYITELMRESVSTRNNFVYGRYVGVHVRLGDKNPEMANHETWAWISNGENILKEIAPFLVDTGIKRLLVVSENCDFVAHLFKLTKARFDTAVETYSTCFQPNEYGHHHTRHIDRSRTELHAVSVFADFDLLMHAEHFFGVWDSNLARVVHRLRAPHFPPYYTHPLGVHTYSGDQYVKILGFIG